MLSLLAVVSANAQLTINVTVGDHAGVTNPTTTNLTQAVIDSARAGIEEWTQHLLLAGPRTLDVHVRFDGAPGTRGSGRSLTTSFVRHEGGFNIYEQAVAAYLRTGTGSRAMEFVFEPAYLENLMDLAISRDCGVALSSHHTFAGSGHVVIEPMTDGVPRLIWESIPLGNYAVEYRDTLNETWRALDATNVLASPPGTERVEDLSSVLSWQRYYRVRLRP